MDPERFEIMNRVIDMAPDERERRRRHLNIFLKSNRFSNFYQRNFQAWEFELAVMNDDFDKDFELTFEI